MPAVIKPPEYEPQDLVRIVNDAGCINFRNRRFWFSKAFAGRPVALRATSTDGLFELYYRRQLLAQVDLRQKLVEGVHHVPEHLFTLCPV